MWPDVSMVSTAILHLLGRQQMDQMEKYIDMDYMDVPFKALQCQVSQIKNIYHLPFTIHYTLLTLTLKDDNIHCSAQNS